VSSETHRHRWVREITYVSKRQQVELNHRFVDRQSSALPLSHRAPDTRLVETSIHLYAIAISLEHPCCWNRYTCACCCTGIEDRFYCIVLYQHAKVVWFMIRHL